MPLSIPEHIDNLKEHEERVMKMEEEEEDDSPQNPIVYVKWNQNERRQVFKSNLSLNP